jgi:hypothetical protein
MMSGFLNPPARLFAGLQGTQTRDWIDAAWGEVYPLGRSLKSEMLKK